MNRRIDRTGQRYGRLAALSFAGVRCGRSYYLCQCDCGNTKEVRATNLATGNTKSCGCLCPELTSKRFWKGGYITKNGYKELCIDSRRVYEHRHIIEQELRMELPPDVVVHHTDGDKLNNNLTNLEVMTKSAHSVLHYRLQRAG